MAKAKRLATKHQEFLERQREKVPGRPVPSRKQAQAFERALLQARYYPSLKDAERARRRS